MNTSISAALVTQPDSPEQQPPVSTGLYGSSVLVIVPQMEVIYAADGRCEGRFVQ
jgi:hypothetical protein